MYDAARATTTLLTAVGAGALLWLAAQAGDDDNAGYWAAVALAAAAGLTLALGQIAGGWTKWGRLRLSRLVFVLAFLPGLLAGTWVLVAGQEDANWFRDRVADWTEALGLDEIVEDLGDLAPAIAFALGVLLGFSFDTRRAQPPPAERGTLAPPPGPLPPPPDEEPTAERPPEPAPWQEPHDDAGRP